MYIDVKETIWERFYVPDEREEEIAKMIKDCKNPYEVINEFVNDIDPETLYDTVEYMDPSENFDNATVEAYDDNNKLIYKNGL